MDKQCNYLGKELSEEEMFLPTRDDYFGRDGEPRWSDYIRFSDDWGFDTRCSMDDEGNHILRIILPVGTRLVRYGMESGRFTTNEDADYELLSLPYVKESLPYHEYVVSGRCEVECKVDKGIVAPGFGSMGGAIQYRHCLSINKSLRKGVLEEDESWLKTIQKK